MSNLSFFFSSLKNAISAKRQFLCVNNSRLIFNFVQLLYKEGLIDNFSIDKENCKKLIIWLKYQNGIPVFLGFKQISKSSQNIYCKFHNLFLKLNREGIFFYSSSNFGIITNMKTGSSLIYPRVGGKILAKLII